MTSTIARTIDLLALAYVFGSTAWFFFVQAPVLVKRMGRDRFVPLQMSLALVLFRSLSVALLVMAGAALASTHAPGSTLVLTALVALAGAVINTVFVLPRALKTGGVSLKEVQSIDEQKSVGNFVSQGGGQASAFWHRVVVVFVLVMLGGLVPHAVLLVSVDPPAEPPHDHAHSKASEPLPVAKWKANVETTEGITTMLSLVRQAAQRGEPTPADVKATAAQLDEAFQNVFRRCTMTGDAHEALHAFLLPLAPLMKELEASEGPAAVRTLHQLEEHLERYATSFE
ncbi:MAG: DUF4149 domain-containing protein [Myxococcales bacterium]|nr:DUF4149 domain-containing protein [Myxococcales bacterium]